MQTITKTNTYPEVLKTLRFQWNGRRFTRTGLVRPVSFGIVRSWRSHSGKMVVS